VVGSFPFLLTSIVRKLGNINDMNECGAIKKEEGRVSKEKDCSWKEKETRNKKRREKKTFPFPAINNINIYKREKVSFPFPFPFPYLSMRRREERAVVWFYFFNIWCTISSAAARGVISPRMTLARSFSSNACTIGCS
jgi:hypothetical protein